MTTPPASSPSSPPSPSLPSPTVVVGSERGFPTALWCLLLLAFAIGTDDFVVAGVLTQLSTDLDVSEAAAGQSVTVFSVTYAVSAPVMAVVTAGLPRRALLVWGMVLFAALNVGAACAPDYPTLLVFRVLAAVTASMMTPAAFATAAAIAPPGRTGRYLGMVATGLTFSLVVGVPVGTWLGGAFGWRSTMVFVVAISLVVAAGTAAFLPKLDAPPPAGLARRLRPLAGGSVLSALLAMVVAASGGLMAFVYVGPILEALSGAGPTELGAVIAVTGVAGIAGAALGGRGADQWGAERTIVAALGVQSAATGLLALLALLWEGSAPILLVGLIFAGWQIGGWGVNSPVQTRLLRIAGDSGGEVVALNTSAMYVGIAVAGAVGGTTLARHGAAGVLLVATAFGVLSILLFLLSFRFERRSGGRSRAEATLGKENRPGGTVET